MMKKRWQDYLTVRCLCLTVLFWGLVQSVSVLLSFFGLEYRSWIENTLVLLYFVTLLVILICFLGDVWRSKRFPLFWKWSVSLGTAFACMILLFVIWIGLLLTLTGSGYVVETGFEVTFTELYDEGNYMGVRKSYHQIRGPFLRESVPVKEATIY